MLDTRLFATLKHRENLESYQVGLADHFKRVSRSGGFAEMGAGKTASTLTAFVDLRETFDVHRMLVIAPKRVAQKVWADEIKDWSHLHGLRFMFLDGTLPQIMRKIQLHMHEIDVWGISTDKCHLLAQIYFGKRHPWDWVVIDESSRVKNKKAKRTKAVTLLTIHPLRVTILTGTPAPNGLQDLWSQIYMIDRGERLGRTQEAFKERFFELNMKSGKTQPRKFAQEQIYERLADIIYVVKDMVDIKKPVYNPIKLDLSAAQMRDYKEFEKEYVLHLPEGERITAVNAQGLAVKLLQFASGAIYGEERVVKRIHSAKIDALREIVEDNPGKPILVAYNFIHEIARIQEAFPYAEVFGDDPTQQDRWNSGEIEMLIAHPKSAAHGLNLQFGGHILVWFSFDYNLEHYLQMNKRLARKGQKNQVFIHLLIVRGTVDEMVVAAINRKDNVQAVFQDELQKHIIRLLKSLGVHR